MKAPNKIYVEVCEDGIFAFPEPPFKESVEYIRSELVEQPHQQEQPEVEKAYKNADRMQYEKGREDALKDLPRWKAAPNNSPYPVIHFSDKDGTAWLRFGKYEISVLDLEKLSK